MMLPLPSASSSADALDLLRRVAGRTTRFDFSVWFWGDAIAIDGLLDASELLGDRHLEAFCLRFFERWQRAAPAWTDYLTPGPALLLLHQRTGRKDLLEGAMRLARWYEEEVPRGPEGVHYYRPDIPQFRTMVIIDSLYHVVPFFALLGHITGEQRYYDEAFDTWQSHIGFLASDRGPLLCHNYDVATGRHRGYGWGRGNGWALFALLELLERSPRSHPKWEAAHREFKVLSSEIRGLQDATGFWRTLLHDREAYLESSTAAFYGAIFARAMRLGLLDGSYREPASAAWAAALSRIDDSGGFFGVSGVTWAASAQTEELALYKSMPTEINAWGQGAALRLIAERLRGDQP
ncbi:MAG: unsaturated rhamnogalacturonyl hydrolase [Rhodospirillaceae bacterium]|nr:unsaturated rhamnogalacturonyl hydrolase [Rhodospirillaceae bacterium]